jgi:4-methyl-5(b-hydroxyethyl)-thiazole monophosphate biosynthesis
LLIEGYEETEAVVVVDVLRRAEVQVTLIGVEGRKVTGSHGISINVDAALDDVVAVGTAFDCVVLPGGMPGAAKLRDSATVQEFVTRQHAGGAIAAAICAAPIALGKFGLLKGKNATCYPGFEEQLGGARVQTDAVVSDGDVVTSRGVGTALAFSLVLVDRLAGTDMARTLATRMLVER